MDRGSVHGGAELRSPSAIADAHGPGQASDGQILTQGKWTNEEKERQKAREEGNAENDQNERGRQRSLPEEQRAKERENEKDRGRER